MDIWCLLNLLNIILYIFWLSSGVHDENSRSYNPKIVRIGLKAHHSVRAVSIDNLVRLWV